jgi:mannose-1-phosphate guanylyltransferase/mannose-6-phosphate isomerase
VSLRLLAMVDDPQPQRRRSRETFAEGVTSAAYSRPSRSRTGVSGPRPIDASMRIYPVILCGGSGTRLWPASRPSRPKQFIRLIGDRSLFQYTVARVQGLAGAQAPIVVAGAGHRTAIERQLAELGILGVIIVEPEGRDSAPAIAAAAHWIAAHDPDGIAVVVASDHHVPDAAAFCASVEVAAVAAAQGRIVTFGIEPAGPSTAYGYIQAADALTDAPGVFALGRFVEKPGAATAQAYVEAGFLWNSGNFVFRARTLIDELRRHAPEVGAAAAAAIEEAGPTDSGVVILGDSFRTAPKISFDYAVMEKTDRAAVAPVSYPWSDLGAWDAVWVASDRNDQGNTVSGEAMLLDSRDCLVRVSDGPLVVGIGLRRLVVVAEGDAVLICDLDTAQGVKAAVDRLKVESSPAIDLARPPAPSLPALRQRLRQWLFVSALPLWWALGADHVGGGFHEALDSAAQPLSAPRRARVQARQIYSYATAGALGWPGPWKQAVEHGLDYFLARYRRPDGLFRTLVTGEGAPADETAILYDQAFALLALASAAGALADRAEELSWLAAEILATLNATRRGPRGFTEAAGPTPYQANPHMHLLKAALAWEAVSTDKIWADLADELAALSLSALIDRSSGALREYFDESWTPAAGLEGQIVEPGHQFEWAWLLERWGVARGRADARQSARRLYDIGAGGIDRVRGVAINTLLDDFSVHDAAARLWPQTEWLKASLILGQENSVVSAAEGLSRYLDDVTPGLWRDKLNPQGQWVEEPAPASSLYHIVCAIAQMGGQ